MNFEEWYERFFGNCGVGLYSYDPEKSVARRAWEACRAECVKTLEDQREVIWHDGREHEAIDIKAIKLIKNL